MHSYIDNYIGEWQSGSGKRLSIRRIDNETASVSLFVPPENRPIFRPWCDNKPSVDMIAKYYPADGPELVVELWEKASPYTWLSSLHMNLTKSGANRWSYHCHDIWRMIFLINIIHYLSRGNIISK